MTTTPVHDLPEHRIDELATLAALYGEPGAASTRKEVDHLHPHYRAIIEAAPFAVLATAGPEGLDASPRGDAPGFCVVADEHTSLTHVEIDGAAYDRDLPARLKTTLY